MTSLDKDELDLLESFERGEWQPLLDKEKETEIKRHQAIAKATFKADQNINVLLSKNDVNTLKKSALIEGIPYQIFMSSIIHKYLTGYLVDKSVLTSKTFA